MAETDRDRTWAVPGPPVVRFRGEEWSAERLAGMAERWRGTIEATQAGHTDVVALVMANHPESVALFFALGPLALSTVVLPTDPRAWCTDPPIPEGTRLLLTPACHGLASSAAALGIEPLLLPPVDAATVGEPADSAPHGDVVVFTSGSTRAPKPVCRTLANLWAAARVTIGAFGLGPLDGVIAALPLSNGHCVVNTLMVASLLRSRLAIVDRFDPHALLRLFTAGQYRLFPAVPAIADALARCALTEPAPSAPEFCTVTGGVLPAPVAEAFAARFGRPLRSVYGTTESGLLAAPTGPPGSVRCDRVGRALPGVALAIGEVPESPFAPDRPGPVWIRSTRYMRGYGFPADCAPAPSRGEWHATGDFGTLDRNGELTLLGRLDDCFKTPSGHLVNPAHIAGVVENCPGVREAAVVDLPASIGARIGVLVAADGVTGTDVRRHAGSHLPTWAWPAVVKVVTELPRLPGGKVDRAACAARLAGPGSGPA
jgi:long-chain acyl-CoA synthetase